MGPAARGTPTLTPASPRPGGQTGTRPTSELLGTGAMSFQTPEAEALDQWFENLQNYEATLEDMAAASLDVGFKEELSAIEQWFKVLSEAERTAALYSLLQHSTQVQIRFFITVLQQMARSDPMTALLSPAMGSMQSQMESTLATLKSPGLKSGLPVSPTNRNFAGNRQSLILDNSSNFLSPDSAATPTDSPAAALASHRAKLKANASHRISAPVLVTPADNRASWGPSQLSQVAEAQPSPTAQEIAISNNNSSRPKSTEFSGTLGTPRSDGQENPGQASWASMVTTPLVPMFKKENKPAPAINEPAKNDWQQSLAPGVPRMGDPTIHRRVQKKNNGEDGKDTLDENVHSQQNASGARGGNRPGQWNGRSPALSNNNHHPNRFGGDGSDAGGGNNMNGLGMQMGNFGGMGLASPTLGMGMSGLGMQPMSPFNMNMLMSPEAQLLAAQMAASGFGQAGWLGMSPLSAGLAGQLGPGGGRKNGPGSARSPPPHSARSVGSRAESVKAEDEVDPALLNDVPAWLRSLRLHKYTPNFEGCKWQDMVLMDEAQLEAKGVAALGARRKMLKTFEVVRKKLGIEGGPPPSA